MRGETGYCLWGLQQRKVIGFCPKSMKQQNKKFENLVQSFQQKIIILCPKTVSRNLPKPSLNPPNRHKKS